jgi:hypothetical protein
MDKPLDNEAMMDVYWSSENYQMNPNYSFAVKS